MQSSRLKALIPRVTSPESYLGIRPLHKNHPITTHPITPYRPSIEASYEVVDDSSKSWTSFTLADIPAILERSLLPTLIAIAILGMLAALYIENTEPRFTIITELVVERRKLPTEVNAAHESSRFVATQVEIIRSPRIIAAALDQQPMPLQSTQTTRDRSSLAQLLISESLSVSAVVGTQVISLAYDTTDPDHGVKFLSAVTDQYLKHTRDAESAIQEKAKSLLLSSEQRLRNRLAELQAQYKEVRRSGEYIGEGNQALSIQKRAADEFSQNRILAIQEGVEVANKIASVNDAIASYNLHVLKEIPALEATAEALSQAEVNLSDASARYSDEHPNMRLARQAVAELKQTLATEARGYLSTLEAKRRQLQRTEDEYARRHEQAMATAKSIDVQQLSENTLLAEITNTEQLLEKASTRLNDRKISLGAIDSGQSGTITTIIRPPIKPLEPVWPKPAIVYAIAVFLAVILGLLAGIIRMSLKQESSSEQLLKTFRYPGTTSDVIRESARQAVKERW